MDINKIKITLLDIKYQDFLNCSSKFLTDKYELFQNCYISKCEDSRFKRMASKLDEKYLRIKKGYQNIGEWWDSYLKNVQGLEQALAQNGNKAMTEGDLLAYVYQNIESLNTFEEKISTLLSPSLIGDVSSVIKAFQGNMSALKMMSTSVLGANLGINAFNLGAVAGVSENQTEMNRNSDMDQITNRAFGRSFNMDGTNANFSDDVGSVLNLQNITSPTNNSSLNPSFSEKEQRSLDANELNEQVLFQSMSGTSLAASAAAYSFRSALTSQKSADTKKQENSETLDTTSEHTSNKKQDVSGSNDTETVIDDSSLAGIVSQSFSGEDWESAFARNLESAKIMSKACDVTIKDLQAQQDELQQGLDSFLIGNGYALRTEFYMPGDTIDSVKALTPEEYEKRLLNSIDYDVPDSDPEIGYNVIKRQEKAKKKALEYAIKFNEAFEKRMGISYNDYLEQLQSIENDIATIKFSKYSFDQQIKMSPYLSIMYSEAFKEYKAGYDPLGEYELDKVGFFKKQNPIRYCEKLDEKFASINEDMVESILANSNLESYERFTLLSEDEKALYSFLYDNKGYKEAEKYLKAMEDTLNNRQGLKEAVDFINGISDVKVSVDYVSPTAQQDFLNALESVDVGDKWYSFFSTTGKGFGDGLQTFGEGFANIFSTEGMISTNQYAQMYILQGFSKDWFLTGTYEVSTSAGNMAPAIAFSAAATVAAGPAGLGLSAETAATVGSTMGYISTGFSVFGNAKNQALVNGNSLASSTLYATCSGVSEVALGKLLGNIGILNENAQFALKEILNEGIEEGLQEFVDAGLRTAFLNEEVEINQLIGDSGKSFLYGIIMSTITTGGQQAIRIVAKGKTHTINSSDAVELLELLNNCDEASQEQVVLDYLTNVENNGHAENIYTPIEVVEEISFKDKLKNFGTDVLNSLGETGAKIASGVVSLNEGLSEFKGKMWQNTKTNAVKALDTISSVNNQISDFRTRIWNSTLSTGGKVVNGIQNVFINVADITGSGFDNYMNFRSDVQNSVKDVVLDTVDSVIDSKVNEFEQVTTLLDTTKETVANLLQVDVVPEDSIGSTFDAFFEDVNTNVKEILHSRISLPKTFIGMFYSPFGVLSKLVYTPVKNNVEVSKTILEDGIYHITSLENAQKILESGYVKASNVLSSYGSKKSFFFAGFPNFENVAVNIPSFLEKTVAVKFDIDEADLDHFRYRSLADHAVAAMGDYVFDSAKASLVYLGLMNDNGKLVYKEIPEETYNSYHTDISTDFLGRRIVTLEKNLVAMAREGGNIIRNVENLLDIIHNGDVIMTAAKVAVGAKNVISSNLNDLGGRITSVIHDYQEKVSSIDQLGPTYEQLEGKRIFDLLNKAIEGKINEPIKALVDEYNNLLDSDGRLAELIRKANNGETVNIPQESMDSYLRLRKLEFSILHPGTMATTGEVQNVFMEQIKNSFDGVSSYVSGLVDKMHSVQVGETLKSNVISIFESLVSMRDDVVNFFGQLKTKAFHRDNDLYHFNTFGLKGNLKDFAQEVMTRGSLSSTLGKQLEKVFFDDNYIVGVHNLGSLVVDSNGRNIRGDKILQNGLILTGNSETRFTGDLSDNIRFYTNKNKKYSFALFLNDLFTSSYYKADGEGSAAIICIPKELEGNMDALVYYKDGQAILKPEYVMGYVNSNEGNLSDLNTLDSLSPSYQELLGIDTIMVDGKAYSVDVLEKLINNVDQAFNKLGNIDQNVDLFGKGFSPQEYVKAAQRLVDELVSKGINVSEEVFSKLNFLQKLYLPSIDSLNLSTTKRYTMDISDIDEAIRPFAEEYLETGFVSEKLGTQLEQWYFDEDTVIGFHALGETLFDSNGRNIMGDAALRNGVILSGNTETGVTGNLTDNIVLETDPSKFNFLFFLRNLCATSTYKAHGEGGAVIVQIPKKLLNNLDALVHEVDGQLYLKPEYVRGYVNSSQGNLSELFTADHLPFENLLSKIQQKLTDVEDLVTDKSHSALIEEFNQLIDSDSRLPRLLEQHDAGKTVQVPSELSEAYQRLIQLKNLIESSVASFEAKTTLPNIDLNDVPDNLGDFNEYMYYIRSLTDKNVPDGFSTIEEYKRAFARAVRDSGKLDQFTDINYILHLTYDPIILSELIGTKKVSELYCKLKQAPQIFADPLSKLSFEDFDRLFSDEIVKQSIMDLDVQDFQKIIKAFSEKGLSSWLTQDTFLQKLFSLDDTAIKDVLLTSSEFYSQLSGEDFNCIFNNENVRDVVLNMNLEEFKQIISSFDFRTVSTWLVNETMVDKIIRLSVDDFYDLMNSVSYSSVDNFLESNLDFTQYERLLKSVLEKFYTEDVLLQNMQYKGLINNIIPLNLGMDSKIKQYWQQINQVTKQTEIVLSEKFSNCLAPNLNRVVSVPSGYYNITLEIDGKIETVTTLVMNDKIDLYYIILRFPQYSTALLKDNLKILSVTLNERKTNLTVFDGTVNKGLNEIVLLLDGQEYRMIYYNLARDLDLSSMADYKFKDVSNIQIKQVIPLPSYSQEVDHPGVYLLKYDIDGKTYARYLATINKKGRNILNVDQYIEKNQLVGISNVRVEEVSLDMIKDIFPSIDHITNVFGSKYGGNQSDVAQLVEDYVGQRALPMIEQQKAQLLNSLIEKYFPEATDLQKVNLADFYASGGCCWMAVANAFAVYMENKNDGGISFKKKIGFDLFYMDGEQKVYNLEAIAFDMFLNYYSKEYDHINDILDNETSSGIAIVDFQAKIIDYFEERNIIAQYLNNSVNSKMETLSTILDFSNYFSILWSSHFDLKQILIDSNVTHNKDKALSGSTVDGQISKDVGGHAMLITDISENLELIVSSWSEKYEFLFDSLQEYKDKYSYARILSLMFYETD